MNLSRSTTSLPHRRISPSDWLDPASAWVQDEHAILVSTSLEPYDWTLDDDAAASRRPVSVPPSNRDSAPRLRQSKPKASAPKTMVVIPIKTVSSGNPTTQRQTQIYPRQKRSGYAVLMLLISVLALFVFAYITQKHGR